jgi:hypothetical protein
MLALTERNVIEQLINLRTHLPSPHAWSRREI